jgi:hypothetical protein
VVPDLFGPVVTLLLSLEEALSKKVTGNNGKINIGTKRSFILVAGTPQGNNKKVAQHDLLQGIQCLVSLERSLDTK